MASELKRPIIGVLADGGKRAEMKITLTSQAKGLWRAE
jgi:hypothetical protein